MLAWKRAQIRTPHTEELVLNVNKMLCVPDKLFIRSLDTILIQNSTAPIRTTPHNLRLDRALIGLERLGVKRTQRMLQVLSHRKLWSLHTNQVFVLVCPALQADPVETRIALVFVALDEVPAENEVLGYVVDAWTDYTHGDVVPGHASVFCFAEFVALDYVLNRL